MRIKSKLSADWLANAIMIVANGDTDKMCKDGWTVYRVKNIVRIDVKLEED